MEVRLFDFRKPLALSIIFTAALILIHPEIYHGDQVNASPRRPPNIGSRKMLKSVIICVVCLAAVGTIVSIKEAAHPRGAPIPASNLPSIQELHTRAHLEGLPIQEIKDPF